MKANEAVLIENMELLMEIVNQKTKVSELYQQKGPGSSAYINQSIRLDFLIHDYLEEKISQFILK